MQRQLYKHVVLDTVLERRSRYKRRVAVQRHMKASLKAMQTQIDSDNVLRRINEATKYYMPETVEYEAPLSDQPLLYRIWVHFKRLFIGENS